MARTLRAPVPRSVERSLDAALDKALAVERPMVVAYLQRLRRRRPGATPAQLIELLERRYLAAVTGTGAAAGGAAALPGVGTGASVASGVAEIAAFVSTTATFVLALAEIHEVPAHDPHVRRALVLTVLLGDVGAALLAGSDVDAKHWAHVLGLTSRDTVRGVNARLGQHLLTRFGARQGALMLGRALPFGVGAGVGAVGNLALGRAAVTSTRRAFGPPPQRFGTRIIEIGEEPRFDGPGR
jgi:hypothetical protein